LCAFGCASTTVKKNPGPDDSGLRYYLPKPYLLLTPAAKYDDGKVIDYIDNAVDIALEMRPDFTEEYSVHVKAGIGINKTGLVLTDGWQLEQINHDVQSNTAENINAAAELLGKLPTFAPSGKKAEQNRKLGENVPAFNVPLGYYESVIVAGPTGKKQMQGWRYVGFMPFNACPSTGCGQESHHSCADDIYGLVYEKGVMVFKKIPDIATEKINQKAISSNP
jgi:hypothetical protein